MLCYFVYLIGLDVHSEHIKSYDAHTTTIAAKLNILYCNSLNICPIEKSFR
jgi:hypothetical protein